MLLVPLADVYTAKHYTCMYFKHLLQLCRLMHVYAHSCQTICIYILYIYIFSQNACMHSVQFLGCPYSQRRYIGLQFEMFYWVAAVSPKMIISSWFCLLSMVNSNFFLTLLILMLFFLWYFWIIPSVLYFLLFCLFFLLLTSLSHGFWQNGILLVLLLNFFLFISKIYIISPLYILFFLFWALPYLASAFESYFLDLQEQCPQSIWYCKCISSSLLDLCNLFDA